MNDIRPDEIMLLGKKTRPYIHDYPDAVTQLDRASFPVGVGAAQRQDGLGDLRPAEPGVHYFHPAEFNSLFGMRRQKTGQLPSQYHLSRDERATGKMDISADTLAEAAAFDDPQQSASANQTAGLGLTKGRDVAEEQFELRLGTQILRNADEQSGLYASGLRRQERRTMMKRQQTAAAERGGPDIYAGLMSKRPDANE